MSRRRTALAAALSLLPLGQPLLLGSTTAPATGVVVLSTQAAHAQSAQVFIKRGYAKFKNGDYQGAIADYNKAIENDPNLALAYYNLGLTKQNSGDLQGAIDDYNKAIEINPELFQPFVLRGMIKYEFKNYSGAIADYSKAIAIDPKFAVAYVNRGLAQGLSVLSKGLSGTLMVMCLDFQTASSLGDKKATILMNEHCR